MSWSIYLVKTSYSNHIGKHLLSLCFFFFLIGGIREIIYLCLEKQPKTMSSRSWEGNDRQKNKDHMIYILHFWMTKFNEKQELGDSRWMGAGSFLLQAQTRDAPCYHYCFLYGLCNLWSSKYSFYQAQLLSTNRFSSPALPSVTPWLCVLSMAGALWKMADRRESLCGSLWHWLFGFKPGQVERRPLGSMQRWHSLSRPGSQRYADLWVINCLVLERGTVYCRIPWERRSIL